MIALIWPALACWAGYRWLSRLAGDPAGWLARPDATPWPAILFRLSASLWAGILPLGWLTYLLAWLAAAVLPENVHPLLVVNVVLLPLLAIWLVRPHLARALQRLRQAHGQAQRPRWARGRVFPDNDQRGLTSWAALVRSLQDRKSLAYILPLLVWLLLGLLMMFATFFRDANLFRAGYTVFSDFAPHTALVSSFSQGRNWPTEYPHFANDGISYHFIFFFICGNLNFLGLPLDWAINLPSILGLLSFCILLGLFAVQLTGRRSAYILTPLLLFCRSSLAFFTHLGGLFRQYGSSPDVWPAILQALLRQQSYIGNTPNDSWGLWGVNVYANQRHLLPGLSVALVIIFLFLPSLNAGLKRHSGWRELIIDRGSWLPGQPAEWRRLTAAMALGVLLPFFHGSVLVALLLFLAVMAIFSTGRLAHLAFMLATAVSAVLQSWLFSGDAAAVVSPAFITGFIAPDKSFPGIVLYLLEMSGLVLPLALVAFCLPGLRRKVLLLAFALPLVFAFTVSLTPDVTVNHKFIMISIMFCNIYIADLLGRLWSGSPRPAEPGRPVRKRITSVAGKLASVILAAVLMITGVQEIIILKNVSKLTTGIDSASPLVSWIEESTSPSAVFVTAPYHYNAFYLSGRMTWLGHAYYAWSAGHDTGGRLEQEQWLIAGCEGDLSRAQKFIAEAGLDYLIIDDTLREHPEFTVNETFFAESFAVAATFPQLGNMVIYRLR